MNAWRRVTTTVGGPTTSRGRLGLSGLLTDFTNLTHPIRKGTTMSKAAVTKLFIGGGLAVIAGAIVAIAAVWIAIAGNAIVMNGPDIVGLRGSVLSWAMLPLGIVGALAIMGGFVAGLVAWIGALLNTWQLQSKAWFIGLLLLGIFNFGFFAMVAFLVAGPDGAPGAAVRTSEPTSRPTPA